MRRLHFALALLSVALASAAFVTAAATAAVDESGSIVLGEGTKAQALTFAPDGNLWFTADKHGSQYSSEETANVIGRVTPTGEAREYPLPQRKFLGIGGIAVGGDGNLWFADTTEHAIGRSTLDGQVTEFPLPEGSAPAGVAAGPDGAIWFAEAGSDRVGRIDANGSITSLILPASSHPLDLAAAAGALWVTENGRNAIARIGLDGSVSEYRLPHRGSKPNAIVRGADGDLWFGEERGHRIGRLDPGGGIAEFPVPGNTAVGALAAAPDGAIFFVTGTNRYWVEVGSLSPDGELTGLGCVTAYCNFPVSALAVSPTGELWYGTETRYTGGGGLSHQIEEKSAGTVGRFQPPAPVAIRIARETLSVQGRYVRVGITCRGQPGASCGGTLTLEQAGRNRPAHRPSRAVSARRPFGLAAGASRRLTLKLSRFAIRSLRRGPLRVTARAAVHGGFEAVRSMTLQRPPQP